MVAILRPPAADLATQAELDAALNLKAPVASPIFTGTVTLPGDPASALQAAPKQYVDTSFAAVPNELQLLDDVDTAGAVDGDALRWDDTSLSWVAEPVQVDSGWILATLAIDITDASSTSWANTAYRKLGKSVMLTITVSIANPAVGKLLFTLPEGYRPNTQNSQKLLIASSSGAFVRIDPTTGTVLAHTASGSTIVVTTFMVA